MDMMYENQLNMYEVLERTRKERFERNRRVAGEHKGVPVYEVGDKVFLNFPKGKFRLASGAIKLAPRNNGPYTILEKLCNGLVYKLKHDVTKRVHNASVTRMVPMTKMVVPKDAVDIRRDRANDSTLR